ncbi:MAG: hypothetical protein GX663_07220 [Clostridiales bacterium]|nr:hypothetical protein [Clostridiales bacterium]
MGTNDGYVERIGQTTYTVEVKSADGTKDVPAVLIEKLIRNEAMKINEKSESG